VACTIFVYSMPTMTTSPAEQTEVRAAIDMLEAWVEAQRVHRELPGLSLGVIHDQTLVWSRGFGWADVKHRTRATPDTLYRRVTFEVDVAGRVGRAWFGQNYVEPFVNWDEP
jgi:CubicO group peptidase (beta-lactamase class C family)